MGAGLVDHTVEDEVRGTVSRYLNRYIGVSELTGFVMEAAWSLDTGEPGQHFLVRQVQLILSEFSAGQWSEDELRSELIAICCSLPKTLFAWSPSARLHAARCSPRGARQFGPD